MQQAKTDSDFKSAKLDFDRWAKQLQSDTQLKLQQMRGQQSKERAQITKAAKPEKEVTLAEAEKKYIPQSEMPYFANMATEMAKRSSALSNLKSKLVVLEDPKESEDTKILTAEFLIKALNSEIGRDAVGNQEYAKCFGPQIRFQLGNPLKPGKFFGRDLLGFNALVKAMIGSGERTLEANRNQVQQRKLEVFQQYGAPNSLIEAIQKGGKGAKHLSA
jgi:hypothetical protein